MAVKKPKDNESHGFIDRMIHGDHGKGSHSEVEKDLPIESKPAKQKSSVKAGASSEKKHQLRKFDKFK